MARITIEDCQDRVDNRFLLVQMAIKRIQQYRQGYEPLIETKNKEVVNALREIAAGKVLPEDLTNYVPIESETLLVDDGEEMLGDE
ncbi:DNA-directed RNA polymerase subunit omega [Desulfovibrio sp. OttesenSCG-928-F07]|nr:DNA-directed RNA polymerase subunit omega [Desulfovibrio sp. OttesenSCG-928-F07]